MNCTFANQECSSGCESGWTLYLLHSNSISNSFNQENDQFIDDDHNRKVEVIGKRSDDEEEDLSMVSDASSGPPAVHLHEEEEEEEEEGCGGSNGGINYGRFYHFHDTNKDDPLCKNSKKNGEKRRRGGVHQDQSYLLDDTASSPFSDFSDKRFTLSRYQSSTENVLEYSQGYSSTENVLEYSQGYSSTQFEVRLPYQEQYDFVQYTQSI